MDIAWVFRAAANAATDTGWALVNAQGELFEMSRYALEFLGLPEQGAESPEVFKEVLKGVSSGWRSLVHPDQHPEVEAAFEQVLGGQATLSLDLRLTRPRSETYQWFSCSVISLQPPDGSPRLAMLRLQDISARKQIEHLLRLSSQRLEEAVAGSPIMIFNTDLQLRTIWTHNLGLGLTPADVIGRAPHEVFGHPDEAAHYESLLRQVIESKAPLRAEVTATLASSTRHYDMSLQPLTDAEGALCGVSGLAIDITRRRRAEAALREADRRKDEFIALLAHELRGPLAPIRTALALLLSGQQPSQAGAQLKLVERQVGHMVRLVDDLLDLSRITADRIRLQPRTFDLISLLDNLVFSARLMASPESIDVRFEPGDSEVRVHADPARLGQVFANLLNNARKFTPPGGRITVRVNRDDNWVSVSIIDTGIGIAPEHLQRVFERFEQLKGVKEDPEQGLGLGLYLARRLIQMHDGRIDVHSDGLKKGSEFRVTLPCLDAGQVSKDHRKQADFFGHPLRVLVVDDHRDTALSLSMLLESWGHQTSCAHDGISGLEAAQAGRPDVVILDIGMPRMNGFEMARRIREQPWGRSLRLMALSGFGQEQDLEEGRQAGIDAHLTKPADPDRLRALLTEWGEIAPPGMRH